MEAVTVEFKDDKGHVVGHAPATKPGWNRIPMIIAARLLPSGPDLAAHLSAVIDGSLIGMFHARSGEMRIVPQAEADALEALTEVQNVATEAGVIAAARAHIGGSMALEVLDDQIMVETAYPTGNACD